MIGFLKSWYVFDPYMFGAVRMKLASFKSLLSSAALCLYMVPVLREVSGLVSPLGIQGEKTRVCDCATLSNRESKAGEKSEVEEQAGGETRE